ncbi:MAG: head-tail connector protein [Rickettsiales bacterium]
MAARHYVLQALTQPSEEPIALGETKNYLRVDHDADDALIASMIAAVRQDAETYIGRSMIRRQWRVIFQDCAPQNFICPMGPVLSVDSMTTYDRETDETLAVDVENYYLAPGFDRLTCIGALYADAITVDYTAGYGEGADDVPQGIKHGMLVDLAARYADREGAMPMCDGAKRAYAAYKTVRL